MAWAWGPHRMCGRGGRSKDTSGAGFALDYVLQPAPDSAWRGWFVSAYATLGSGHDRGGD
jgi:hypothetical protein